MPEVQRDDVSIHYEVEGTGPSLVFLHGLSLTGESWRRASYVDAMKDHHRCITVDLRGAGRSVAPTAPARRVRKVVSNGAYDPYVDTMADDL
jgi:pimeloyl-ACP methyl ester carboxylesterase